MKIKIEEQKANGCKNNSCACKDEKLDSKLDLKEKTSAQNEENKSNLDPTHFGDWQLNCRAIDF